jgi:hypothetical protein
MRSDGIPGSLRPARDASIGDDRMPTEYAWKTRADLFDELCRLEADAGVSPGIGVLYGSPEPSRLEYDARRRGIRQAYFAIGDPQLRARMIGLAVELQHRERAESSLQRLSAQRALAQARDGGNWLVFALAILLPVVCVWIGYLIAGVPGELGGIVVAVVVAVALARDQRRRIDRDVAAAKGRLSIADDQAKVLEERPPVFDAQEAASGLESVEFGALSATVDRRRGAASRDGARLWVVPRASSGM